MAALSEFATEAPTFRRLPREQVRLVVAIIISTLAHLWLADGVPVSAPGHAAFRSPTVLSAQLEIPPPPFQDGAMAAHERVPDSQNRVRPADDGVRKTAGGKPASFPPVAEKMPAARAATLPPAVDPMYYPARQLDVYPALIQPVRLEYPGHTPNDWGGGRALLMLLIDETGGIHELSIIDAGPGNFIETALRAAFSEARFSPARKDGRAVKSRVLISIDYRPGEVETLH